jgi:hypothetical protein
MVKLFDPIAIGQRLREVRDILQGIRKGATLV